MQQIIKKCHPFVWVSAIMFTVIFAYGCNDNSEKKAEPAMETTTPSSDTLKKSTTDTLPVIDTSASSRPEGIKNGAPQ